MKTTPDPTRRHALALLGGVALPIAVPAVFTPHAYAKKVAPPPADQLAASLQHWLAAKKKCNGNYDYQVSRSSFTGARWTTHISVRGNKVVERRYETLAGPGGPGGPGIPRPIRPGAKPQPPKPPQPKTLWKEKGKDIGKNKQGAPAKTIDELYADAEKVLKTKLQPHQKLYTGYFENGLLRYCFWVDTRIADDAPTTGVRISRVNLHQPATDAAGPVVRIKGILVNPKTFKPGRQRKPIRVESLDDAKKIMPAKAVAALKKQVDFEKQVVLVFAWRGSGQDKLNVHIGKSNPETVSFQYSPGRTRDLRPHLYVFAVRKDVRL